MDIVLAVFKHKLGTPTIEIESGVVRAPSGTAEELLFALNYDNSDSPIGMTYFYSQAPSLPFNDPDFEKSYSDRRMGDAPKVLVSTAWAPAR